MLQIVPGRAHGRVLQHFLQCTEFRRPEPGKIADLGGALSFEGELEGLGVTERQVARRPTLHRHRYADEVASQGILVRALDRDRECPRRSQVCDQPLESVQRIDNGVVDFVVLGVDGSLTVRSPTLSLSRERELIRETAELEFDEEIAQNFVVRLVNLPRLEVELDVEIGHDRHKPFRKSYLLGVLGQRPRRARWLERLGMLDELLDVRVLFE